MMNIKNKYIERLEILIKLINELKMIIVVYT